MSKRVQIRRGTAAEAGAGTPAEGELWYRSDSKDLVVGDGSTAGGTAVAKASHTHAAADLASGTIATARLGSGTANGSTFLRGDQTWAAPPTGVTSVAISAPAQFSVSGSPVTSTGTLALSWANQNANIVFAGPASGSAAAPAFRALVGADLPASVNNDVGGILRCPCHASTTQACSSNVAYWCYVGYRPAGEIIQHVRFAVSSLGAGAQTAEVCVATSPSGPNGSAVTLTKVWADGSLDDLTSGTGIKGNTAANTTPLAAAAHVYVGFRTAMATTQPTVHILQRDWGQGFLLQTTSAGSLTGGSSWTGTPVTFGNNTSPDIRGYL